MLRAEQVPKARQARFAGFLGMLPPRGKQTGPSRVIRSARTAQYQVPQVLDTGSFRGHAISGVAAHMNGGVSCRRLRARHQRAATTTPPRIPWTRRFGAGAARGLAENIPNWSMPK